MAVLRDRPYSGRNFLVAIGDADGRAAAHGFAEVVFPPFTHADGDGRSATAIAGVPEVGPAASVPAQRLLLRRGVTGSLDLFQWWREARPDATPPSRTVAVHLLGDDLETVVLTWRFHRAYPVRVSYSPLRAGADDLVMETVELAFDRVEMT